ncbi:MAG: ABC transporter ATP-binding protein, partial [Bacilli bacterium]
DYALYPHMSIEENMGYGLKVRKFNKEDIKVRVHDAATILGLSEYLDKKPKNLSGGQRQRVALGRAMVREPRLFLLDEPLSNLDAKLRVTMRSEITSLQRRLNVTTIYVTHDQVEAMTMADKIVVMKDGLIMQVGSPLDLYDHPANLFVASFIGTPQMNLFDVIFQDQSIIINELQFKAPLGLIKKVSDLGYLNKPLKMGVRPEYLSINPELFTKIVQESSAYVYFDLKINNTENMGSEIYIHGHINQSNIIAKVSRNELLQRDLDTNVEVALNLNNIHLFDLETQQNIEL